MAEWSREQEAAYKEAKKTYDEASAVYTPLRSGRDEAVRKLGEVLWNLPRVDGHAGLGLWAAERSKMLVELLAPFLPQEFAVVVARDHFASSPKSLTPH